MWRIWHRLFGWDYVLIGSRVVRVVRDGNGCHYVCLDDLVQNLNSLDDWRPLTFESPPTLTIEHTIVDDGLGDVYADVFLRTPNGGMIFFSEISKEEMTDAEHALLIEQHKASIAENLNSLIGNKVGVDPQSAAGQDRFDFRDLLSA